MATIDASLRARIEAHIVDMQRRGIGDPGAVELLLQSIDDLDIGVADLSDPALAATQAVYGTMSPADKRRLDNLNSVFNVKDYGAVGDETTDDTSALQDAIDAAADFCNVGSTNLGATVYFPHGVYRVTSHLLWRRTRTNAPITFRGEGFGFASTIVRATNGLIFRAETIAENPDVSLGGWGHTFEYLGFNKTGGGGCIEYFVDAPGDAPRPNCTFQHVIFASQDAGSTPLVKLVNPSRCKAINCRGSTPNGNFLESVLFRIEGGSFSARDCYFGGRACFLDVVNGSEITLDTCRTEGGYGIPAWRFENTHGITISNCANEGFWEADAIFHFVDCTSISILNAAIAVPDRSSEAFLGKATYPAAMPSLTFDNAADTIVRASGSWIDDGFQVGHLITIRGSSGSLNDGQFTVTGRTASTLTCAGATFVDQTTSVSSVSGPVYCDGIRFENCRMVRGTVNNLGVPFYQLGAGNYRSIFIDGNCADIDLKYLGPAGGTVSTDVTIQSGAGATNCHVEDSTSTSLTVLGTRTFDTVQATTVQTPSATVTDLAVTTEIVVPRIEAPVATTSLNYVCMSTGGKHIWWEGSQQLLEMFYNEGSSRIRMSFADDLEFAQTGFITIEPTTTASILAGTDAYVVAGGDVFLQPADLLSLFGAATDGGGAKVMSIAPAGTVPTNDPTGNEYLVYNDSGNLVGRGANGTIVTLGTS